MARIHDSAGRDRRPGRLPPRIATVLRPELDSLAEDIMSEIRRTIPEYGEPPDSGARLELRASVEQTLRTFVDQISGSDESRDRRDQLCRALGRSEAYRGRSLDALQAAYRTGVQVAWRRVAEVGRRHGLSSTVMSQLADALFAYIDELASLSVEGFEEARSRTDDERAELQRRLLWMLVERPRPSRAALERAADAAGWSLPAEVTPVALPPRARCVRAALGDDVLADLGGAEPHLVLPGPLDADRRAVLLAALPERRAATGLTVPPGEAADSLRWARRTLALVDTGIVEDAGLTAAEDHLLELWLLADGALLDQVARRRLAVLARMGATQRLRLTETLGAWLETQGNAVETAKRLQVHPQTVRYRLRQITEAFGEQLTDPESRFALEAVLRAGRLRERSPSLR
ncbi:helix-turn-helix domain-containing protein [Actinomadura rugatobispora]|uniref:Helix-turn-helix domain-containing protein n=1 Tax=Actinomadura rugatobispora TaxID=1994 RepID=A0ABW0ZZS3_9ACTN|nr:PucR family transcriptional regulator [Actinomadura rugatobispora]